MSGAFGWASTPARTIPLFDVAGRAPAGRIPAVLPLRWPDKPAGALLDYTIDATALTAGTSDVISLSINDVGPLGLVAETAIEGLVTLWLSGGTAGQDVPIDLTLSTTSGRRVNRIVRLAII